jgi:hypothetical protein
MNNKVQAYGIKTTATTTKLRFTSCCRGAIDRMYRKFEKQRWNFRKLIASGSQFLGIGSSGGIGCHFLCTVGKRGGAWNEWE